MLLDREPQLPCMADELRRRMAEDQYARGIRGAGQNVSADSDLLRIVDEANTRALARILETYGWPGITLVGQEAATAAWLIAQHAPLELQLRALPLLAEAAAHGQAPAWHVAYLSDRILMRQDQPQVYGSQYCDRDDGQGMRLWPLVDPDRVDERRTTVGLGPIAEYEAQIRATYAHTPTAPTSSPDAT
ncbi:DUF6624 domain-containing protein [Streptomyces sp. NPDC058254]|uniref:DUF6624 domain-containing protein n=1 Tax=Streptomyces sp. NPDC058254 TaxID=3346406 RepID=UPI0036E88DEC